VTEPPGQTTAGSLNDRDAETARLLLASDQEGLRRLVGDHASRVRATLQADFKNVLDHSEIDDALNQATHRVWRARERVDLTRGTLRAWYYSIARNCSLRLLTSKRGPNALRFVEDLDAVPGRAIASEVGKPSLSARQRVLYEAIDKLPALQRAVLLADLAAGGTADTAILMAQLNTTRNSIYVARANGLKGVRAYLTALGYPPDEEEGHEARRVMP
jgi:DNA-directed RNA polymerase specialized sigma24 family protein